MPAPEQNSPDSYGLEPPSEPGAPADLTERYLRKAEQLQRETEFRPKPKPPRWPMVSGVFTFPWYPQTLAYWLFISLGMIVTGLLLMLLWSTGAKVGLLGPRLFGPPAMAAFLLTFSYGFACALCVVEETSNGADVVEEWPEGSWKEWVWSFAHVVSLLLQAGLAGLAVRLAGFSDNWFPFVLATYLAFPIVLLGALSADGAWTPLEGLTVLRSMVRIPRQWLLFYASTGAMAGGWWALTAGGLAGPSPWIVPVYSGPLLAAILLIYARLIGRLARCIAKDIEAREEEESELEI